MNVNKLLNKFAGIEAGQRANAALPQQALLIVGQMAAANQVQGATDHRDAYQRAKNSLQAPKARAEANKRNAARAAAKFNPHQDSLFGGDDRGQ